MKYVSLLSIGFIFVLSHGCGNSGDSGGGNGGSNATTAGTGLYLYVSNQTGNSISTLQIDTTTGIPSLVENLSVTGGPKKLAISHNEACLFVALNNGNVGRFQIDQTTGKLTQLADEVIGGTTASVVIHPSKNYLYPIDGSNPGNVYTYTIDQSTCEISQKQSAVALHGGSYHGRFYQEKYLMIPNSATTSISVLEIDSGGGATDGELTLREQEVAHANGTDVAFFTSGSTFNMYATSFDLADAWVGTDPISKLTFTDGTPWIGTWNFATDLIQVQNDPHTLLVDETLNVLWAASTTTDQIIKLDINATTGDLSVATGSPILVEDGNASSAQEGPGKIVINPALGSIAYVVNNTSGSVSTYNYPAFTAVSGGKVVLEGGSFDGVPLNLLD